MIEKQLEAYIHLSKYSRWIDSENRREPTWSTTVGRLKSFWFKRFPEDICKDLEEVFRSVENKQVMPSMRSVMTAGKALERDEIAGFNCCFIAINNPRCFDETFYLLMNGCGVGFSVERQYINEMPKIAETMYETQTVIKVQDSKIGWAKSLKELITLLYSGDIPKWDLSAVRPAGARLRTFGGRASGPGPLDSLLRYTVRLFRQATGRRLNSIECHDLICKIASTVIVGSVRRSACISLSNLTDSRMARAKSGEFYLQNPERSLANNSVAYTEKPDLISFLEEMKNLYESKSGERGIVNKVALEKRATSCGREHSGSYGLNPCAEAILRDTGGICNLTEVVVRPSDTLETLKEKVRMATILGTIQSTLCDFRYLRKVWSDNQKEERLLGVSITGIMDHPILSGRADKDPYMDSGMMLDLSYCLRELKAVAIDTNREWAERLGIPYSKQLTLVKPSGTVSLLCGTSAGMHPRFAPYYFRRVTQDIKDPLTDLMIREGVPHVSRDTKVIFSFPMKSPEGSVCAKEMGAMKQLEVWKIYSDEWCEGNPSQTIYYTDGEFLDIQAWLWKHWDSIGGLSFFPLDDYVYDKETQPYLEITKEEYEEAAASFPEINWDRLPEFEREDTTTSSGELACSGGNCEL
jgi:ribonucleoside-triphosphate reductase (thioredoxin)